MTQLDLHMIKRDLRSKHDEDGVSREAVNYKVITVYKVINQQILFFKGGDARFGVTAYRDYRKITSRQKSKATLIFLSCNVFLNWIKIEPKEILVD